MSRATYLETGGDPDAQGPRPPTGAELEDRKRRAQDGDDYELNDLRARGIGVVAGDVFDTWEQWPGNPHAGVFVDPDGGQWFTVENRPYRYTVEGAKSHGFAAVVADGNEIVAWLWAVESADRYRMEAEADAADEARLAAAELLTGDLAALAKRIRKVGMAVVMPPEETQPSRAHPVTLTDLERYLADGNARLDVSKDKRRCWVVAPDAAGLAAIVTDVGGSVTSTEYRVTSTMRDAGIAAAYAVADLGPVALAYAMGKPLPADIGAGRAERTRHGVLVGR